MDLLNNQYDSILAAIADLKKQGYNNSFNLTESGLYCPETKQTYQPENVEIVAFHRFEGTSDFEDMSIVYVVETNNGAKGIIIDAFGTYADTGLGDFLKRADFRFE